CSPRSTSDSSQLPSEIHLRLPSSLNADIFLAEASTAIVSQVVTIRVRQSEHGTNKADPLDTRPYPGAVKIGRYRDQERGGNADGYELREVRVDDDTNPPCGHRMVAEFIASDASLLVYRRFGVLTARRLAMMQLELSRLERQWELLEKNSKSSQDGDSEEVYEHKSQLERLLPEIDEKLEKYQKAMLLQSRLCALEDANPEVVTSLRNWYQGEQHIDHEEYEYLEHSDDLAALASREGGKDFLQKILEKNFATWYPIRLKPKKIYKSDKITAYSEDAAAKLSRVILTVSMLCLMVAAILLLGFINDYYTRLAFATGMLIVIAAAMSLTSAKTADIIIATAGYASVMGAFLQKSS
ncbi:hypothetical protein EDB80DRAFT_829917, partial [Ilyonectria destructans]